MRAKICMPSSDTAQKCSDRDVGNFGQQQWTTPEATSGKWNPASTETSWTTQCTTQPELRGGSLCTTQPVLRGGLYTIWEN